MFSNGNKTDWGKINKYYHSGSIGVSDFKSAEYVVLGWFEIMSMITLELKDKKPHYQ